MMTVKKQLLLIFVLFLGIASRATSQGDPVYYIYDEAFKAGKPGGTIGSKDGKSLKFDPASTESPLTGTNCFKVVADGSESWQGFFVQHSGTWKKDNNGTDLSTYKYLVFSVRADKEVTLARIGMGEGDEGCQTEKNLVVNTQWQRYVFEVNIPRHNINGLFLVVFEGAATIYFDDIFYAGENFTYSPDDLVYKQTVEPLDKNAFYVYADKLENGIPSGYSGEKNGISIKFDPDCRRNPYKGAKCIRFEVTNEESWRMLQLQYSGMWSGQVNKDVKLPDLSAYRKLVFYARSEKKGTVVPEIGFGGGGGATDEDKAILSYIELTPKWKKYEIFLEANSKERVNTLFFIVFSPGVVYFDEIKFVK